MPISRIIISVITVLLLSACRSHSGYPGNITAEAVSVVTTEPRIAYPMKAMISLQADQAKNDVPVSLYAIEKTDDPNIEARQIPLGTVVLEQVNIGTNDYALNLTVPASVEFAGTYYLSAIVDEANIIDEFSKDDNWAVTEIMLADSIKPNILLSEVALDRTALIINTDDYVTPTADNTYNADAGGTITVGADGLALGESIDIEAFASLRIMRSDNGTSLDMPLYLWNTAEGRYNNAYGIDPVTEATVEVDWLPMGQFTPLLAEIADSEASLDDIRRDSEHIDFYFPGKLGSELETVLRYPCTGDCVSAPIPPPDLTAAAISQLRGFLNSLPFSGVQGDESAGMAVLDFDICVKIRSTDPMLSDDSTADNEVCKPIDIYLPPLPGQPPIYPGINGYYSVPTTPLDSSSGYATNNSNSHFAFNLDFGVSATADDKGFIGNVTAVVPVRLFGKDFDFVGINVRTQLVPDYLNKPASEESGYNWEIRFLGQVLDYASPVKPLVSFDNLSHFLLTPNTISYTKEIEWEPKKPIFVGPIPLVPTGFIAGNYGLDYSVGYADDAPPALGGNKVESLGASIGPFANLEAGLSLGIEIKIATVGVEGALTLFDERIVYFIGTDIEVIDDGYSSDDVEFIITPGQKLSNIFTGPQGALKLFVKYPTFTWTTCKVGIIKYRCIRIRDVKRKFNLYTTPALFRREDVLFEDPFAQLDVVKVSGEPTAYFTTP